MPEETPSDRLDDALRTLAHSSRRAMIRLTTSRDVPATELADLLGIAPATASEHLRVLRKTGFVRQTVTGTWRFYRADLARVEFVLDALMRDLSQQPTEEDHP
jgi:DNA-binding transcriptional ArsR family regulator